MTAERLLVPLMPTERQLEEGRKVMETCPDVAEIYRRMVLAAGGRGFRTTSFPASSQYVSAEDVRVEAWPASAMRVLGGGEVA